MLDTREVATSAELARKLGLSRPRISQILHALDLAPEIQAYLDALEPTAERFPITERRLRDLARIPDWDDQLAAFERFAGVGPQRARTTTSA